MKILQACRINTTDNRNGNPAESWNGRSATDYHQGCIYYTAVIDIPFPSKLTFTLLNVQIHFTGAYAVEKLQ